MVANCKLFYEEDFTFKFSSSHVVYVALFGVAWTNAGKVSTIKMGRPEVKPDKESRRNSFFKMKSDNLV